MIVAALVTFAILLLAWLLAPADAPSAVSRLPAPIPGDEAVAPAA